MTPETAAFLDEISALPPVPAGDAASARTRRRYLASRFDSGPASVTTIDESLGRVRVRSYHPSLERSDLVIVYVHGGGWIAGDVDTHDGTCRRLAASSGLEVVSVDYRRPPEHVHPAAVRDVLEVVIARGGEHVVLAGDSAGAHVAVEVALELRSTRVIDALVLIQPANDPRANSASWQRYATGYFLTAAAMAWYWSSYVPAGSSISALSDRDLRGLPRCYILTSSLDPSQDDGVRLAQALREADVPAVHEHVIGVPHGCFTLPRAFPSVQGSIDRAAAWAANESPPPLDTVSTPGKSKG